MLGKNRVSIDDLEIEKIKHIVLNCDLEEDALFIGQDDARDAFEFGLEVKMQGYNIYVCDESGHNEKELIKIIEKQAKKEPVPYDWCYVYNFEDDTRPIALSFIKGVGSEFKESVSNSVNLIIKEIDGCLQSIEYKDIVSKLKESYYDEGEKLIHYIKNKAKTLNFYTQISDNSIYFVPIINNKKISEKTYDELSLEAQEKILTDLSVIEQEAEEIMEKVKQLKKEAEIKIKEYEELTVKKIVDRVFEEKLNEFRSNTKTKDYIDKLQQNISEKMLEIINKYDSKEDIGSLINASIKEELQSKYCVNLLIDNCKLEYAPIIYSNNPNYNNVSGRIEYSNELGNYVTDFMKIKSGLLHAANGGYLVLNIKDVLSNVYVWEIIKEALINEHIDLESVRERIGTVSIKSLAPEAIPLNVKIIFVGNYYIYQLLYENDDKFIKLFKVQVQLDNEICRSTDNDSTFIKYVNSVIKKERLYPITENAKQVLFKHSARIAGSKNLLTTKLYLIEDIVKEANYWASKHDDNVISSIYIEKAIKERERRSNLIREKVCKLMYDKVIKLDLEGIRVGQINAIVISSYGDCTYGRPSRVTATTYLGQNGIINIEKEAGLSGSIYNKGINVISGYIGEKYAQEFPLCLNAHICIEQNYSDIDGDSASCAELIALVSSLSDVGINQGIAVTGSVDQKGNIQAVGGIIEKIEGYFKCCKYFGLTGKQGVIIPKENLRDLVLEEEIINAIKYNKFNIYAVSNISETLEILTGKDASEIETLAIKKLKKYYDLSIN